MIGVSAMANAFSQKVIDAMAKLNARPIVFALSNPTSKSECTAEQAYAGADGQAMFACGSPFDPVTIRHRTWVPRQGNNSYIFPGIGLGAIAVGAPPHHRTRCSWPQRARWPSRSPSRTSRRAACTRRSTQVREVSAHIAAAVAKVAFVQGHAAIERPADLLAHVRSCMYEPEYPGYV